jgi:hypothetical protein
VPKVCGAIRRTFHLPFFHRVTADLIRLHPRTSGSAATAITRP